MLRGPTTTAAGTTRTRSLYARMASATTASSSPFAVISWMRRSSATRLSSRFCTSLFFLTRICSRLLAVRSAFTSSSNCIIRARFRLRQFRAMTRFFSRRRLRLSSAVMGADAVVVGVDTGGVLVAEDGEMVAVVARLDAAEGREMCNPDVPVMVVAAADVGVSTPDARAWLGKRSEFISSLCQPQAARGANIPTTSQGPHTHERSLCGCSDSGGKV